jgi:hypothetical protein
VQAYKSINRIRRIVILKEYSEWEKPSVKARNTTGEKPRRITPWCVSSAMPGILYYFENTGKGRDIGEYSLR